MGRDLRWQTDDAGGEPWFGFECVRQLAGPPPEILLIGLIGQTFGHCGVAISRQDGWLLHIGDAYSEADEVKIHRSRRAPAVAPLRTSRHPRSNPG